MKCDINALLEFSWETVFVAVVTVTRLRYQSKTLFSLFYCGTVIENPIKVSHIKI